jgi:3-deoxy-7-phosphoheptulonate synthase
MLSDANSLPPSPAVATTLPPPDHLIRFFPIAGTPSELLVDQTRQRIRRILSGDDDRLLVVMGPCSIHDPAAALEYAQRLAIERDRYGDTLEIVMRVYFEKPRTTVGWKGLINDPYLLIDINRLGLPAGSEFLDVISPQYIGDLIAWGAIGARTTESQVHRELASGLSAPIGFKNGTDGNIRIATDAIQAAARGHHFLSVHKNGQVATVQTRGNRDCHVILRGGKAPNYDAASIEAACAALVSARLNPRVMVDCSHANSGKQPSRQAEVARSLAEQIAAGSQAIAGAMLESNLQEGAQPYVPGQDDRTRLAYGMSITDACMGWPASTAALALLSKAVESRRMKRARAMPSQVPSTPSYVHRVDSASPDAAFADLVPVVPVASTQLASAAKRYATEFGLGMKGQA